MDTETKHATSRGQFQFDKRITEFERAVVVMVESEWSNEKAFAAYVEAKCALNDAVRSAEQRG